MRCCAAGSVREDVEGPEQRDRRRLVPCGQHRRRLLDEDPVGHGGFPHHVEQIARRLRIGSARRLRNHTGDMRHPAPAEPPAGKPARARDAAGQQKIEQGRPPGPIGILLQFGAQSGPSVAEIEREQRRRGDVQRQQLQPAKQVDRSPVRRVRHSAANSSTSRSVTCATMRATAGIMRGARNGAAARRCAPPVLAGREQHASADDRSKQPMRRRGAPVIIGVLDQNVADRFRVADDDLLTAGKAAGNDHLLEGARRKPGERVVAQARADLAPRLALGRRERHREGGGGIRNWHVPPISVPAEKYCSASPSEPEIDPREIRDRHKPGPLSATVPAVKWVPAFPTDQVRGLKAHGTAIGSYSQLTRSDVNPPLQPGSRCLMTLVEPIETQTPDLRTSRARRRIEGPAAWVGADMRRREAEWTYCLSPTDIAEIEQATRDVRARGIDIAAITSDDFPLPTLGPGSTGCATRWLTGAALCGCAACRSRTGRSRSAHRLLGGRHLFRKARSQNAKGHLLGHVFDLEQGLSADNPHIAQLRDRREPEFPYRPLRPRRAVVPAAGEIGRAIGLVSAMTLHNVMAERRPDLLERLYRPMPVDRRGEVPEGKAPFYEARSSTSMTG